MALYRLCQESKLVRESFIFFCMYQDNETTISTWCSGWVSHAVPNLFVTICCQSSISESRLKKCALKIAPLCGRWNLDSGVYLGTKSRYFIAQLYILSSDLWNPWVAVLDCVIAGPGQQTIYTVNEEKRKRGTYTLAWISKSSPFIPLLLLLPSILRV